MNYDGAATVLQNIQIIEAIEVLEYHDRNYLSFQMAQPNKASLEKQRLLAQAKAILTAT